MTIEPTVVILVAVLVGWMLGALSMVVFGILANK